MFSVDGCKGKRGKLKWLIQLTWLHSAHKCHRKTRAAPGVLNALMLSKIANKILGSTMNQAINNTRLPVWHHLPDAASLRRKGFIYLSANAKWSESASAFVVDRDNAVEAGGISVALLPPYLKGQGLASPSLKVTKHQRACSTKPSAQPPPRFNPLQHGAILTPTEQAHLWNKSTCFSQLLQSYCGTLFDGTQQ